MVFEKGKLYKNKLGEELLYIFKNLNRNVQESFTKEGFSSLHFSHCNIIMDNQEIIPAEAPHPFLPFIENAWYKTREGKRVQFKFCTGGVFPYPNIFLNEEKQFVTYTENGISNTGVFQGSKDIIALLEV